MPLKQLDWHRPQRSSSKVPQPINQIDRLARKYLDPGKIQIFVVGDKLIKVINDQGAEATLEETLMDLAESLGLPYREIELR